MDAQRKPLLFEIYLTQRGALKRFLTARLGNEEEAEDLVQELFFRLERATISDDVRNPTAYLYKIALNLAHDHRREQRRARARDGQWLESSRVMIGTEPVANLPTAEAAYDAKQRLAKILNALDDLSPQCRRVFVMHKFEGLSHPEIAMQVGISRSTVEKHMGTALKHLLRRLGQR